MIYLKIMLAAMKTKLQTVRVSFWILLGLVVLFTNLALNRTSRRMQESTTTPATQTETMVAGANAQNEAGSTDGIMIVAVIIVLIVIIPILLKRRTWENGKRDRTAPPN
jgi:hypothetical protein